MVTILPYRDFYANKRGFQVSKIKQLGDRVLKNTASPGISINRLRAGSFMCSGRKTVCQSKRSQRSAVWQSLPDMLERMEKSGLIIRQQDPGDKRKTLLFLTDMAKALKDDYDAISDRMSEIYYQGFTEDEIRTFEACLERIRLNLEGWQPK